MENDVEKIINEFKPEKSFGYIKDDILESDYILGGLNLPTDILQPTGQWDAYIPTDELQRNEYVETYNCTGYGTCHALAFLFKRLFGEEKNWSERYVGIAAGTQPPGNSPQVVIETIRKDCGLLEESVLPFNNTIKTLDQYYSPKPLPWLMKENGKQFTAKYAIKHEWVFSDNQLFNRQESLKIALQYSPIGIAVAAWTKVGDYYVRPQGAEDNHWCVIYGYEDGKYFKCYDSYDSSLKQLDWNFGFERAKRYHIEKLAEKKSLSDLIRDFIKNYFKTLFK